MNGRKNKGFSLIEVLAGSALVGLWAISSLQILQSGLSAIDRAYQKTQAAELLSTYHSDAQNIWYQGHSPSAVVEVGAFLIESEINEIDSFNATAKVRVSWGKNGELTQTLWLSR